MHCTIRYNYTGSDNQYAINTIIDQNMNDSLNLLIPV